MAPEAAYHFEQQLPGNARSPITMAENCQAVIEQRERPFFLYFCTADPHRSGPRGDLPHNADGFGNLPTGGYPGVQEVKYRPEDVPVPAFLPDNAATSVELAQYYQSQARIDQGLGRLVELLKNASQYDNTLILFTSDHGMAFPAAKTNVYDAGLRVPLIVRSPSAKQRGVVLDAMISFVDITPTLLDAAGATPKNAQFHGRSFLPILEQAQPQGWDEIFAAHNLHEVTMYFPMRAVRNRRYKLIWNIAYGLPFPFASDLYASATWQSVLAQGPQTPFGQRTVETIIRRPRFELYDLQADPNEARNLAEGNDHAQVLAEMKGKLKAFSRKNSDPWHLKWARE